ncbi:hypothetical protein QJS66_20510 [Kocuria rhizophila]|nr:hypothetical protein QJS66_20510 [Kocuria rhizophila]
MENHVRAAVGARPASSRTTWAMASARRCTWRRTSELRDQAPGATPDHRMALAIEPMLVRGDIETRVLDDDWTVVTVDGSRASQRSTARACTARALALTAGTGGAAELAPLGAHPVPIPGT